MADDEALRRLRHDLGKYVHLEARWLSEDATAEELRDALRTDLARTRRGPEGDESCAQVWARLRPAFAKLEVSAIDVQVEKLVASLAKLDSLDVGRLRGVADDARVLADLCRRLGD